MYGIYDEHGNALGEGFESLETACDAAQRRANELKKPLWVDRMAPSEQGNPAQIDPEEAKQ